MKISPMGEPLERLSLEELKTRAEFERQDIITVIGGMIFEENELYDFLAKRKPMTSDKENTTDTETASNLTTKIEKGRLVFETTDQPYDCGTGV